MVCVTKLEILSLNSGYVISRKNGIRKRAIMPRRVFVCLDCKRNTQHYDEIMVRTEKFARVIKLQCTDCFIKERDEI